MQAGITAHRVLTLDHRAGKPAFRIYMPNFEAGFPACRAQRVKNKPCGGIKLMFQTLTRVRVRVWWFETRQNHGGATGQLHPPYILWLISWPYFYAQISSFGTTLPKSLLVSLYRFTVFFFQPEGTGTAFRHLF